MQLHLVSSTTAPARPDHHLTAFVFSDLRFDISAIKAVAKAHYALKLDFINAYGGEARRYWHWRQARRAFAETWKQARGQRHSIVWSRLPRELPFTRDEDNRREVLLDRMRHAGITADGNARYREASGEYGQIVSSAQRRAYDAILREAREAV